MPLLTLPPAVAFRSLYHREWRLELWHLTVGDLLHGNDPLHQHDQSTDTWRGGERWRLLKCSCSRDIQENSCCHCDWFWHWYTCIRKHVYCHLTISLPVMLLCDVLQGTVCLLRTAAPLKSPGLWTAVGSMIPETDHLLRNSGSISMPYTAKLYNTLL